MRAAPPAGGAALRVPVTPRHQAEPASTTLSRLRLLQATALVTLAVWAGIGIASALGGHTALLKAEQTLIPQVAAAQQIEASLASLDAATAEQLLRPAGSKVEPADAAERNRTDIARALLDAAESGSADRVSLASLEAGLGTYEQLVQHVRDLRDRGDSGQWSAYRQAVAVVDQQLTPRAERLDRTADGRMRELGEQQTRLSHTAEVLFLFAAALTVMLLIPAQMFLSRRTRRTLNPSLLAATLLCLVVTGDVLQAWSREAAGFHRALAEAYPALHAGWQARTAAATAREEESRATLDESERVAYLQKAAQEREAVATLPSTLSGEQLVDALEEGRQVEGFRGFLADEISEAPERGERDAAIQALSTWVRSSLPAQDRTSGSVRGRGNSSEPFERALGSAIQAHQRGLARAIEETSAEQVHRELLLSLMGALACLLVLVGFAPRIREYK